MRRFARIYAWSLVAAAFVIIAAAAAHRMGVGSQEYVHSPLIGVQIFGLLALFLTVPASVAMTVVVAFQRRGREVLCLIGCILLPVVAFAVAASINPATLVYMT